MMKMNFTLDWHEEKLQTQGLRVNDQIEFYGFSENKKTINLKRSSYLFSTHSKIEAPWVIPVPSLNGKRFEFSLHLINDEFYIFESLSGSPFKINGHLCFKSFIEKGDLIEFGLNEIKVPRPLQKTLGVPVDSGIYKSPLPILLEGETGTGKSSLAKKIHDESGNLGPFVHINLSSFSKSLFESELFGHKKGAFTGAMNDKKGALREANGGTLFIDEVDSLPLDLQVKLLLFLDSGIVRSVGSEQFVKVQTKLIFASGKPLKKLVSNGDMREDFFFRITSGHSIKLFPLRKKPHLIKDYIKEFEQQEWISICPKLITFYQNYSWPGNIRQLKGHLLLKKQLTRGPKIEYDHHDERLMQFDLGTDEFQPFELCNLEQLKRKYIQYVLYKSKGRVDLSAKVLKISPTTVRQYMRKSA